MRNDFLSFSLFPQNNTAVETLLPFVSSFSLCHNFDWDFSSLRIYFIQLELIKSSWPFSINWYLKNHEVETNAWTIRIIVITWRIWCESFDIFCLNTIEFSYGLDELTTKLRNLETKLGNLETTLGDLDSWDLGNLEMN